MGFSAHFNKLYNKYSNEPTIIGLGCFMLAIIPFISGCEGVRLISKALDQFGKNQQEKYRANIKYQRILKELKDYKSANLEC